MNTPMSWLKVYVPDLKAPVEEFVDAITLSGSHVEGYEKKDKNLEKIVVGKIEKIEKHPDADKLIICQVNIGEDAPLQIVTGAPNVKEGDLVPTVLDGGKVAGGHDGGPLPENGIKIKKGKLRGVESYGMMCAIEELGANRELYPEAPENGVYVFPEESGVKPGDDAIEALGLHDAVVEYEITSNRVDCFSMIGMAREAAATYGLSFHPPIVPGTVKGGDVTNYASVEVEATDLCPRYCARVVKNLKIGPSPKWMRERLASQGIRSINNLVDITNYVMEEYGQPMHAYDLDTIADHKIIVKRAKDGDKFVTLDGQERNLDSNVLMICDGEKEIGIAGIMGGENSMVTDHISTLLFEAACFDGTNIRLSSKRIGMRTDASAKFEKGLDPNLALEAINRACQLIEELGCGEVVEGVIDIYPDPVEPWKLPFEPAKMNHLLGMEIPEELMLQYFERLGLSYDMNTNELTIPTFRQDLHCMADLAEEVARLYGYDKLPATLPRGEATVGKKQFHMLVEDVARDVCENNGFSGGMTYSFESPKVYDKLLIPQDSDIRKAIVISNPLGEDFSIMRTISLNGMITSLATNFNRRNKDARLYEIGNIYLPKQLPLTELPEERKMLTLGMYGQCDFFNMKGVLEELFEKLGLHHAFTYNPKGGYPFLHPGRQAAIQNGEDVIGYIGQLHPEVVDNYNMKGEVYVAVVDLPKLTALASFDRKYEGIAKFPASTRDLSMVMSKDIFVGQVEEVIKKYGGNLLENYELFDVYEGEQVGRGKKSVAYTMTFRAKDRNLEASEVNAITDKIIAGLQKMGIELRG
ncbi:phenylalanine--tRNA ligase beta subunit [Clostridium sp. CAG:632]|nr:phenylalanine--tRNA ligase subunit beta [Lachnospiraceae bacterium]CCY59635.1 phenylalanine--tRNA ligase beta subunit [Clostridium sp. CAG:632]